MNDVALAFLLLAAADHGAIAYPAEELVNALDPLWIYARPVLDSRPLSRAIRSAWGD